jgi:DNA-binding MarR family transcriptional regulator
MNNVASTPQADDAVGIYFAEVERICTRDPWLSPLGGGILAGITLDVAHDSRAFARALGIEHAIVLREIQALVELDRLVVTKRDERTHRCSYVRSTDSGSA